MSMFEGSFFLGIDDVLKYGVVVLAGARRFSHIERKREIGKLHTPISLYIYATKIEF